MPTRFLEWYDDDWGYEEKEDDDAPKGGWNNPNCRWDSWTIGGRASGLLSDHPKEYRPSICDFCNGTGSDPHVPDGKTFCRACHHSGLNVSMPDDIRPVKHVDVTKVTSAYDGWKLEDVVTPTGEWINLASPGDAGELQAILDQHKDCWAVIVDCHI